MDWVGSWADINRKWNIFFYRHCQGNLHGLKTLHFLLGSCCKKLMIPCELLCTMTCHLVHWLSCKWENIIMIIDWFFNWHCYDYWNKVHAVWFLWSCSVEAIHHPNVTVTPTWLKRIQILCEKRSINWFHHLCCLEEAIFEEYLAFDLHRIISIRIKMSRK